MKPLKKKFQYGKHEVIIETGQIARQSDGAVLVNIEGIHWFTLFDKSGVEAHEYINTISNFILNGLKKKSEE